MPGPRHRCRARAARSPLRGRPRPPRPTRTHRHPRPAPRPWPRAPPRKASGKTRSNPSPAPTHPRPANARRAHRQRRRYPNATSPLPLQPLASLRSHPVEVARLVRSVTYTKGTISWLPGETQLSLRGKPVRDFPPLRRPGDRRDQASGRQWATWGGQPIAHSVMINDCQWPVAFCFHAHSVPGRRCFG